MNNTLSRKVLVLNQSYEPLMVIGAKRAIILLLSDKSECVANYSDIVRAQSFSMNLPSVIRVNKYIRFFKGSLNLIRDPLNDRIYYPQRRQRTSVNTSSWIVGLVIT